MSAARRAGRSTSETDETASGEHAVGRHGVVCLGCRADDVEELARAFSVEVPGSAEELAQTLSIGMARHHAIVLDCRTPNPLVLELLTAEPAVVGEAIVVLWGASRVEAGAIRRRFRRVRTVVLDRAATASDIADVIGR